MKKAWVEAIYQSIKIPDLILVALYNLSFSNNDSQLLSLDNSKKEITFERLLKECFELFPQKFKFLEFNHWPDARKIDRPLRSLRLQKLISIHPKESFLLTKSGKKIALETMKFLKQKKLELR